MNEEIRRVKELCREHGWDRTVVEDAMVWEVKRIHAATHGTRVKARAQLWKTLETMNAKGAAAFSRIRNAYTF